MCKLVPVLRVIGFVFLVIAIVALLVGFVSPFWIHLPPDHESSHDTTTTVQPEQVGQAGAVLGEVTGTPTQVASTTPSSSSMLGIGDKLSGLLKNGSYHGLWAKCFQNFSCSCFWQDDFAMEKAFPVWHYVVQGLFGVGLVVLIIALKTASFHVCCCHCCRDSYAIATVIGSMIMIGLLLITLSLAVYGAAASIDLGVFVMGDGGLFHWAYYTSLGGVVVALLAAIFFIIEGCRGPGDMDGDGEETAKMV